MKVKSTVGVIIPAKNEEESIALVLQAIPARLKPLVLVVNNNSADRTALLAEQNGAVVLEESLPGYGNVMLRGLRYLKDHPVEVVVFLDGDYSDYPEEMGRLIQPITQDGYDMVLSTRLNPLFDKASLPFHVVYGNRFCVFCMNALFGTKYTDLGPFRAIRYDRLIQLDMKDRNFGWTAEMQAKAAIHGLRVTEVPVRYRTRVGTSKISGTVKGSVLAGAKILYTIFKLRCISGHVWSRGQTSVPKRTV
jgi:glycosyltransferase involved in cell wall biosynthesis